jgi:N-acyl-L-homoserine lactone synthetase
LSSTTRTSKEDSSVGLADRVAERVIDAVPYRLEVARSEAEREAVFRLRYLTVVEMGWANPDELPDGIERTEDDDDAIHVVAREGDELVGTARIVLPRDGRKLPLEREFGLRADPGDVEVGRTVVVRRLRGATGHGLVVALFARCWQEMRALGYTELVSAVPPRLADVYRSLGFTVIELGSTQEHWGEERIPVRFDVIGSVPELRRILGAADEPEAAPTLPNS